MTRTSTLLVLLGAASLLGCFQPDNSTDEIGDTGTETLANTSSDTSAETSTSTDTSTTDTSTTDASTSTDTTTSGEACEGLGGGIGTNRVMDGLFPQPDPIASCCDIFAQDCAVGQKCVPYGESNGTWSGTKCVDIQGNGQAGDACTFDGILGGGDDCGQDSYCFFVEPVALMSVGICTPFCGGSKADPICPVGTACVVANNDALALCTPTCDPLLQDCSEGGCHYADSKFTCLPAADNTPLAGTCEASNQCAPGGVCAPAATLPMCAGDFCCASYCSVTDPVCQVPGTECVPFYDQGQAPPGSEDIGVCILPA